MEDARAVRGLQKLVSILFIGIGGACASAAFAADAPWHWVWLSPTDQGWEPVEGNAIVTFKGSTFTARLEGHARNYDPILVVTGRVRTGKVDATVVQEGTDASPRQYVGEMQSIRSKTSDPASGWGDDRITLRDHGFFLGLHRTIRPADVTAPAEPPALIDLDPNSEESRKRLALEQDVALEKVSKTKRNVVRKFAVGWEMHHGLYLVPSNAKDWLAADWSTPDFLDEQLQERMVAAATPYSPDHVGQKLICRCTGIPWSFYGEKRFLVRQAELTWE